MNNMSIFGAYLEDYHEIKIIVKNNVSYDKIILKGNKEIISLIPFRIEKFNDEVHLHTCFNAYIKPYLDYYVYIGDLKYHLNLGKITRSPRFDYEYHTDMPLGALYNHEYTIFRVWSPVSKEMYVVINEEKYPLKYIKEGVYEGKVLGDLINQKYYYMFRIDETYKTCIDPYALANTPNFKESIVVDLLKCYEMKSSYVKCCNITDCIIEEISIRDLTSSYNGKTIKDATESVNFNYGLGYLKNLPFTHLQVMPVNGFGGVDEITKDDYNWGYNPVSYFSISNYLTKGDNPTAGIDELRMFVDTVHHLGKGVCLDVVFNHVYNADEFACALLCPGYFYHVNKQGFLTNASGCGNDLNTLKYMVRRLIKDVLTYFVTEFKVDGFRFDLMNLLDVNTLNDVSSCLKKINPAILLYGEGWNMDSALGNLLEGKCENFWQLPDYSFFNDYFRNFMKCNFDASLKGFLLGAKYQKSDLYHAMTGYAVGEVRFSNPKYSINFVECHDNHTFYDCLKKLTNEDETTINDRLILSLGCVMLALGVPFYHLGQELKRSKGGHHNSYNLGDEINKVDYGLQNIRINEALKSFAYLRNNIKVFKLNDPFMIKQRIILEDVYHSAVLRYHDDECDYLLIIKNDLEEERFYFSSDTYLIYNQDHLENSNVDTLVLNKVGIYLLKK